VPSETRLGEEEDEEEEELPFTELHGTAAPASVAPRLPAIGVAVPPPFGALHAFPPLIQYTFAESTAMLVTGLPSWVVARTVSEPPPGGIDATVVPPDSTAGTPPSLPPLPQLQPLVAAYTPVESEVSTPWPP
jgi:hypothetical protein